MRRNYRQTNRGTATTARPRAGASRRRTQTESYDSAGRSSRAGTHRMPQSTKKSNQNVIIGVLIGCAAIVLIVIVVAMSGGSDSNLESQSQEKQPEKQKTSPEKGKVVQQNNNSSTTKKETSNDPMVSNPDKNEENLDDDASWNEKDPTLKPKGLGNRRGFNK